MKEKRKTECDCCGKMKYDCINTTTGGRWAMDVHVCPECRHEDAGSYEEYEYEDRLDDQGRS